MTPRQQDIKGLKERFEDLRNTIHLDNLDWVEMVEPFIAAEVNKALDAVSLKQEQKKSFCGGKNECKRQTTTACQHHAEGWNFAVAELEALKAKYREENGV